MRKILSKTLIFVLVFTFIPFIKQAQATSTKTWSSSSDFSTGTAFSQTRVISNSVVLDSREFVSVSIDDIHSLGLKSDGTLWAWGDNSSGELGLGHTDDKNTPTQVGTDDDWNFIDAGELFSLAIKTDGTLWGWGDNNNSNYGTLGLGEEVSEVHIPTQIGTDTNWESVSAGANSVSLAIKEDGSLWGWGYNYYGELGLGDTNIRYVPTQIGSDTDWETVSTAYHSLAIKTDGTLWSWGRNGDGELGQGDLVPLNIPTKVGTDTHWEKIQAGRHHSLAVKEDGSLWGWGYNEDGELGLGDVEPHYEPIQVGTDTDWKTISAVYQSLALKTNNTMWVWGYNYYGQLGLGDYSDRHIPTQLGSDTDWTSFSAGYSETLAIKSDNTLLAWGYNFNGQLGLGDDDDRNVPTEINSYPISGTLTDLFFDALSEVQWATLVWSSEPLPEGTEVKFRAKTSDDGISYSSWSNYFTESTTSSTSGEETIGDLNPSRFIKLEITLTTSDTSVTPTLNSVSINYNAPVISSIARKGGTNTPVVSNISELTRDQHIISITNEIKQLMQKLIELLAEQIQNLS